MFVALETPFREKSLFRARIIHLGVIIYEGIIVCGLFPSLEIVSVNGNEGLTQYHLVSIIINYIFSQL